MAYTRSTERGPGSNQHADKPPLPPTEQEKTSRRSKSSQAATGIHAEASDLLGRLQEKAKEEHLEKFKKETREKEKKEKQERQRKERERRKDARNLRKETFFSHHSGIRSLRTVENLLQKELGLDDSDWEWAYDRIPHTNKNGELGGAYGSNGAASLRKNLEGKEQLDRDDLALILGANKKSSVTARKINDMHSPPVRLKETGHVIVFDMKGGKLPKWKGDYVDPRIGVATAVNSGTVLCGDPEEGDKALLFDFKGPGELAEILTREKPPAVSAVATWDPAAKIPFRDAPYGENGQKKNPSYDRWPSYI